VSLYQLIAFFILARKHGQLLSLGTTSRLSISQLIQNLELSVARTCRIRNLGYRID